MKIGLTRLAAALAVVLFASGCLYSDIKVPLDRDVSTTVLGPKIGYASNHSVLWLFAWGDGSTEAAARNGDLKVINHLDEEIFVIFFGAYTRSTTVAYGE